MHSNEVESLRTSSWGRTVNNVFFFVIEAIIGMKRSAMMIVVAKMTILVSLLIFGFFLIVNLNLASFSQFISDKLEVKIYLKEGLTKKEINNFYNKLSLMESVKQVDFKDKESSWTEFKKLYPNLTLNAYIVDNPLPHTLVVKLKDSNKIEEFSKMITMYQAYCEKVNYGGSNGKKLQQVSNLIIYIGWGFVGVLSLATFLIMMNTITLTIMNRNEEISIMRLVGATDGFIIGPFIMEGLILGISSSLISITILNMSYKLVLGKIILYFPYLPLIQHTPDLFKIYVYMFVWGIFLSSFAAFLSLKSALRKIV